MKKPSPSDIIAPTASPVEIVARAIENACYPPGRAFDPVFIEVQPVDLATAALASLEQAGRRVVPRSILTDTKEALETTDDWHVFNSANWTLYHQIDALLHPETIGIAAARGEG